MNVTLLQIGWSTGKNQLTYFTTALLALMLMAFSGYAQTVTSDKDDYAPGEVAIISGSGWAGDNYVDVHFEETPAYHEEHQHDYHGIAVDADGNWEIRYQIEERHLGVAFDVHVVGKQSGAHAHTYFTDANITFSATGLPSETSLQVSYRVGATAEALPTGSFTTTTTFTPPATPLTIAVEHKYYIEFTFPDKIVNGITYVSKTIKVDGTIVTGPSYLYRLPSNSAKSIEGIYVSTCTAPLISTSGHPASQFKTYGENASFTVAASGTETLTYQWQVNSGTGFTNISDATSASLTLTKPTVSMNSYQYRCVVTNGCGIVNSNAATLTVNPKSITGTFVSANKVYDGNTSAAATDRALVGAVSGDDVSLSGGTAAFADANAGTNKVVTLTGAALSGAAAGNYTLTSVATTTANIAKAETTTTVSIATGPFTYTGSAITPASVRVTGAGGLDLTPAAVYANNVNAGTATASYSYADGDNYLASSDSKTFAINKATATLALGNLSHEYDGTLKSATATVEPAGLSGVSISGAGTDFGTYAASASLDNANYTATAVNGTLSISKAPSAVSMDDVTATYNGSAHAASATATGAGGLNTTADITYSYAGTGSTTYSASATAPTNAGTYSVTATYAGGANHTGSSKTATVTINKATATLTLANLSHEYDGTLKSATASTSPAGLEGVSISGNGKTNAGTYEVVASLVNDNYVADNVTGRLVISKADQVISWSNPSNITYGTALSATQLNANRTTGDGALTYSPAAGEVMNAGTHTLSVTAAATDNYNEATKTVSLVVEKAGATVVLSNLSYMFDGSGKRATVTTTPANISGVSVSYNSSAEAPTVVGSYTVVATLNNSNYRLVDVTTRADIANVTETLTIHAVPTVTITDPSPIAVNTDGTVVATYTAGTIVTDAKWIYSFSNSATDQSAKYSTNTISGNYKHSAVGVFLARLEYKNAVGDVKVTDPAYVVFFDPSAGFVTGGGWITSKKSDYTNAPEDAPITGKATFGFVSKYEKGAKVPSGNTQFQFNLVGMNFKSTVYEWLTVSGSRAQYKGSGTINGQGDYGFLLTAVDGEVNGKANDDRFRIKIWDKASGAIVYDNQREAGDDADVSTVIGGGSIVIHQPSTKNTTTKRVIAEEPMVDAFATIGAYPNPLQEQLFVELPKMAEQQVSLTIYSLNGRVLMQKLVQTNGTPMRVELNDTFDQWPQGVYLLKVNATGQQKVIKLIK